MLCFHHALPFLQYGELSFTIFLLFNWTVWTILLLATVHDIRQMIIPDRYSYSFILLSLLYIFYVPTTTLLVVPETITVLAGPVTMLPIFLMWFLSGGRAMGFADVKLALGMGWLLGLVGGISAVVFGFWVGAIISVGLLIMQKIRAKKGLSMKSEVPFGPYLIIGTGIVWFTGTTLATLFL
jgi:prepilin signal peptidase PulO-like enzyme (type II secretory pathway)